MRLNREKTKLTNKRWAAYAAAGAAGAVAALGPQISDASITYVELNSALEDQNQGDGAFDVFGPYTFGASGASFVFNQAFNETGTSVGILTMIGYGNIGINGASASGFAYVGKLAYGVNLSTQAFDVAADARGDMAWGDGYANSQWTEAGSGFVGFQFDVGNGTQYGWAEVVMNGVPDNRATLVGYAYADAGAAITTGQTTKIPEPGSLGVLALGSMGLLAWRRKRTA